MSFFYLCLETLIVNNKHSIVIGVFVKSWCLGMFRQPNNNISVFRINRGDYFYLPVWGDSSYTTHLSCNFYISSPLITDIKDRASSLQLARLTKVSCLIMVSYNLQETFSSSFSEVLPIKVSWSLFMVWTCPKIHCI